MDVRSDASHATLVDAVPMPRRAALERPPLALGDAAAIERLELVERVIPPPGCAGLIESRPMRADDGPRLAALLRELSPQARALRFHGGVRELPAAATERLVAVDPQHSVALAATRVRRDGPDHGREIFIAEARYAPYDEAAPGRVREFALVVADAWQRCGIGERLLRTLIALAHARGVGRLEGEIQNGNKPMLGLAHKLGFTIARHPNDGRLQRAALELSP